MMLPPFATTTASCLLTFLTLLWLGGPAVKAQDTANPSEFPTTDQGPPISLPLARLQFDLVRELCQRDNGKLWGHSLEGPLILVDPATRFAVANQAAPDGSFQLQGQVWTALLPEDTMIANTSVMLGGQRWTMVRWDALNLSLYDRARLLMHESFHRLQHVLDYPQQSPTNAHLETLDGRLWLRLEMRAWQAAMLQEGAAADAAARDALCFRLWRHRNIGTSANDQEQALEANEGLAEYTGYRLCGLPQNAIDPTVASALQRQENQPQQARSFAYATGPAVYRFLDRKQPDWRRDSEILAQATTHLNKLLNVTRPTEEEVLASAQRYRYDEVLLTESLREQKQQAIRQKLQQQFIDGPLLVIETSHDFQFTFDPQQTQPLSDSLTIYRPLKVTDHWGTLDAPAGGLIRFQPPMQLSLPFSDDPDWKLQLKHGFEIRKTAPARWTIAPIVP